MSLCNESARRTTIHCAGRMPVHPHRASTRGQVTGCCLAEVRPPILRFNHMPVKRFQFSVRSLSACVAVAAVFSLMVKLLAVDNSPRELFLWAVSRLDGDCTVYSEGYREADFCAVKIGMTASQVESLLGEPLWRRGSIATDPAAEATWGYSGPSRAEGSYWVRAISFRKGIVSHVDRFFRLD